MERTFEEIILDLQANGFDFNRKTKLDSYNPLEYFVEQVSSKEIRHSQIIADLLDVNGPHQYRDLFLDSFLQMVNCEIPNDCTIDVEREKKISRVITKGSDRSIDIVLTWKHRQKVFAIIIENKLNGAGFQPCQLDEYKRSLERDGYIVKETIVIYDRKTTYGNGVISLCSTDISNWLNSTLESCDKDNTSYWGIKAYSQLIDNMAIKNINMINAECIVEMARNNSESYHKLSQIVKAYEGLRDAVFCELQNSPKLKGINSQIDKSQLQFWNDEDYNRNKLFIVIEFNDSTYSLYLKNDNSEKDRSRSLAAINFEKWNESKEWYVSKKESEINYSFPQDTERLIKQIKKLIEGLKTING